MRIDVGGGGFDSAAEALFTGSQLAASYYTTLTGKLAGFGAMAGDDKSSEDFVASYDTAAKEGVGAANDIVDAFATLGVLTATTVENHRKANAGSVYGKPPPVYDGSGSLPEGPVDVPEYTPPSALGGDNEDLPEFWNHVVDHLQGWTWPSADTGRLREAATAWKALGDSVDRLTSYCDTAVTMFQGQKSPEVPLAIDAVDDLRTQLTEGAAEFRAIGQSCSDYADQVEQTREVIKGFLQDLAIEAGISVAAGIIVGIFTFGGGAAAGGGIAAWRAVACARKIIAALKALKAVKAVTDIARVAPKLTKVRSALEKFKDARALRAAVKAANTTKTKLTHSPKQLQKKFKHAKDFDVEGNFNPAKAKEFQKALDDFVDAPSTLARTGTYRGQNVVFNYDPATRLCVIQGTNGTFVSGWKLSADQFRNLIQKGVVGGG